MAAVTSALAGSSITRHRAAEILGGRRVGPWRLLVFAGPAIVASVAYIDPGNFATNIQAGSSYGYRLMWVVFLANILAMLFQALSAKLGIVTGQNLCELCRRHFPPKLTFGLWILSEVAAMATDLAEFLGAALALNLLFHIPMLLAALIVGVATYAILSLQKYGFRPLELVIAALVGLIAIAYVFESVWSTPDWKALASGSLMPWLGNSSSVTLAAAIVGATIMPHTIYLHSALTQERIRAEGTRQKQRLLRFSTIEVVLALGVAGIVNVAMTTVAAATYHYHGNSEVADIATAYRAIIPILGDFAGSAFLIALLAAGLSSSVVGTLAGQVIMQGFLGVKMPVAGRRLLTMTPAVAIIAFGVNPMQALIVSQVVLSAILPVPLIALIILTSRRDIMGDFVSRGLYRVTAICATIAILMLNVVVLIATAYQGG